MHVRKELIENIAIEENYSFLLDLDDLMPELKIEMRSSLIQKYLVLTQKWKGYKFHRDRNEILTLSKENYNTHLFLRFSIFIGNGDTNMYFGITGPLDKAEEFEIPEIAEMRNILHEKSMEFWTGFGYENMRWVFKYFRTDRNTLFNCIKNNESMRVAFQPFLDDFLDTFSEQLDSIENINLKLTEYYNKK